MERFVQRVHAHAHRNTHVHTSASHDVSRRSSRQILFRKIGLPLSSTTERQQLCVGGSSQPTNTHVTCVRACESASEKLSRLSPQSSSPPTFNLSLFFFQAPNRDTSRIFSISQPRGMMSPGYGGYRQTIGSRNPRLPIQTMISRTEICEGRATFCMLKHSLKCLAKMSKELIIYDNLIFF